MSDFLREIDARHLLDGNHYPHELPEEKDRIDLALDSARRRIIDFLEAHTAEKDPLMEEVRSSTRMKALRSAFDFVLSPGGLLVDLATLNGKQRTDLINHELGHLMIAAFSESIDPNEVKVSKFQNFSVMLGKPQGYVSYKYKTSSQESDDLALLEEEEETYGRPYYDLDNVDDREACEQILTLLAGPAASYVKTGSFLDLKKYFDEILIRSGGEEDAFTLDKSLAFSRKYHNRADEITRKFFNLLVEFFSDDDIKPAMNVLGSEIAIHGGIERDDLSKYVKGITGKSLSVIGSEIDTYFKINSRFEKMITKGKAILTSIH